MNRNQIIGRKLFGMFAAVAATGAAFGNGPTTHSNVASVKSGGAANSAAFRQTTVASGRVGSAGSVQATPHQTVQASNKIATVGHASGSMGGNIQGMKNAQSPAKAGNGGATAAWMQKPMHGQPSKVFSKSCDPTYYQRCGVKKSYGYCYEGYDHSHWYCRSWSNQNNCWFFYDTGCSSWYYWCQPTCCYYPCSYRPYNTYCCTTPVCTTPVCVEPVCTTPVCTTPVCEPVATYATTTPVDVTTRYLVTTQSNVVAQSSVATPLFAAPKLVHNGRPQPVFNGQPQPVFNGQPQPVSGGQPQGNPGQLPPMPGETG